MQGAGPSPSRATLLTQGGCPTCCEHMDHRTLQEASGTLTQTLSLGFWGPVSKPHSERQSQSSTCKTGNDSCASKEGGGSDLQGETCCRPNCCSRRPTEGASRSAQEGHGRAHLGGRVWPHRSKFPGPDLALLPRWECEAGCRELLRITGILGASSPLDSSRGALPSRKKRILWLRRVLPPLSFPLRERGPLGAGTAGLGGASGGGDSGAGRDHCGRDGLGRCGGAHLGVPGAAILGTSCPPHADQCRVGDWKWQPHRPSLVPVC